MKRFAVLDVDNIVINTIIADTKEIAETATGATCIEFDETNPAGFNQLWDGEKFLSLIKPEAVIEEQPAIQTTEVVE